jgi:hypothetical protein
VFEVAPSLYMVELQKSNGDTLEYHNVSVHVPNVISSQKLPSMASANVVLAALFGHNGLFNTLRVLFLVGLFDTLLIIVLVLITF